MACKLEGQIDVPTGGWDASVNDGGGAVTMTIPAGTYFLSSPGDGTRGLLAELEYQLENTAGIGGAWSVSMSATDGLVSISGPGTFSIAWTDTDLRDVLGFTGTISGTSSYDSPEAAAAVWLPQMNPYGHGLSTGARGRRDSDRVVQVARSGRIASTLRATYTVERFLFRGLPKAKIAQEDEATVNESLERFWTNYLIAPGITIRYYKDASDATSYQTAGGSSRDYIYVGDAFEPKRVKEGFDGAWEVALDFRVAGGDVTAASTGTSWTSARASVESATLASVYTCGTSFATVTGMTIDVVVTAPSEVVMIATVCPGTKITNTGTVMARMTDNGAEIGAQVHVAADAGWGVNLSSTIATALTQGTHTIALEAMRDTAGATISAGAMLIVVRFA